MTVTFRLLGYTVASIEVDLTPLLGAAAAPTPAQHRPPIVNAVVKRMSDGWVKRMLA